MTDVSNLDNLAAAISTGSAKIRNYAIAQAAATQSQETDIQNALSQPGIPGPTAPSLELHDFGAVGSNSMRDGYRIEAAAGTYAVAGTLAGLNSWVVALVAYKAVEQISSTEAQIYFPGARSVY